MQTNFIAVPCDFMEDSFNALLHAAYVAERGNSGVLLMHLTADVNQIPAALTTIETWAARLREHFKGEVKTLVAEGDIVEDIGKTAEENECTFVIMPTHGMHGKQHFTGSLALYVVSESHVPFIIVQKRPIREHGYKRIVIPVDYRPQLVDEAGAFVRVARLFHAEVHLVVNEKFKGERDASVLPKTKELFESSGIHLEVHTTSLFNFNKAVLEYAASVDADLICAINYAYENLYTMLPRTDEEELIYNAAQIPVMLITPHQQDDKLLYMPMMG